MSRNHVLRAMRRRRARRRRNDQLRWAMYYIRPAAQWLTGACVYVDAEVIELTPEGFRIPGRHLGACNAEATGVE